MLAAVTFCLAFALSFALFRQDLFTWEQLTYLPDAKGYATIGKGALLGQPIDDGLASLRGYFYPGLAVGLALIDPALLVFGQVICVTCGVALLADAELKMTGRIRFAWVSLGSISLLLSPSAMMTEPLAFLLGATALRSFICDCRKGFAIFALGLAAIVKPSFLPVLLLAPLLVGVSRSTLSALLIIFAMFAAQAQFSRSHDGSRVFSSAGTSNFSERFFPAVYGIASAEAPFYYTSSEALTAREYMPRTSDQIRFVLRHPVEALEAWAHILWRHHLSQSSGFVSQANPNADRDVARILRQLSGILNHVFLVTTALGIAGVVLFTRRSALNSSPASLLAPSLIASAPLVYWQGDRIIFIPYLLLLPFAAFAVSAAISEKPERPRRQG